MHRFDSQILLGLRPTTTAALMLVALAGAAQAQSGPHFPPLAVSPPRNGPAADDMVLKRLPAGKEELTFRGENASRSWTVALGRSEAARTSTFQIAMLNGVSLLPERSSLKLVVNGTVLAVLPASSPEKVSTLAVKIPTGVLVPGLNTVQISAALTHQVDCSVKATYELWALLDPVQTGFLVPKDAANAVRSLDDLAIEPLAEDGTTRIHLRMDAGADPADIGLAGHFIDTLAARANLARPIVDVGPGPGEGAGFDVVIDKGPLQRDAMPNLKIFGKDEAVTIGRDASSNRLVVILSGEDAADLDNRIAALSRVRPHASGRGAPLEGGTRQTFADLGLATESFSGRHYLASIDVALPPDFYPANDRARLLIDGSHSASLAEGSELVFRVNGTLVSSMPLAAGKAERLQDAVVDLPLRFFHSGHNDVSIEGMTSAYHDRQCDVATMPHDPRLTILGTSTFEFPDFAHLATLPQIPAALAYDSAPDGGPINLYLPDADLGSVGAGLTVLANMAVTQSHVGKPIVHFGELSTADAPGIVLASAAQLPDGMATALRQISTTVTATPADGVEGDAAKEVEAAPTALEEAAAANEAKLGAGIKTAVQATETVLRSRGFFFAANRSADLLPATGNSMLVAAVAPDVAASTVGGLELPQFVRDPSHWLLVTAPNAEIYEAGIRQIVAGGQWNDLGGRAVSFDLKTEALRSLQPSHLTYVLPSRVVLSDIRPILGGIVSNNIVLSIALLVGLMSILGMSTHLLVRRVGAK